MLKGEIKELIFQRVNGGKATTDTRIFLEDIEAMLAPAINFALTQNYYIARKNYDDINYDFISTFYLNVAYDTTRELNYVDLPSRVMPLPNNKGNWFIGGITGKSFMWSSTAQRQHNSYYPQLDQETIALREGDKIYLQNLAPTVTQVMFQGIMSLEDLDDDQDLPVPAGTEFQIINLAVEFFTGQRAIPDDRQPNQVDSVT